MTTKMEVLKQLAEEHKRHVAETRCLEEISNIIICGINDDNIHVYKGLIGSGLQLLEDKFVFSNTRQYSILVDGVQFFELQDASIEEEE